MWPSPGTTALDQVPADRPCCSIANEFFDALPVRQLIRLEGGWHEIQLGLDALGRLAFGPAPQPLAARRPVA